MDNLIAEGKAKPFIIVMENGGGIGGPGAAGSGGAAQPARPLARRTARSRPVDAAALAAVSTSAPSSRFSLTT